MRSTIKSASVDVLGEAFSHMNRLKLCTLQRVCRSFRDAVDTHFHSRPTYSPRGQRFHIVATTEDTDTLIYSDLQYVCASVFNVDDLLCHPMSRGGREYVFPHLSLAGIRDGNTAALIHGSFQCSTSAILSLDSKPNILVRLYCPTLVNIHSKVGFTKTGEAKFQFPFASHTPVKVTELREMLRKLI